MNTYNNTVVINGQEFTNIVNSESYAEVLKIQKERKAKSKNTFKGRLIKV